MGSKSKRGGGGGRGPKGGPKQMVKLEDGRVVEMPAIEVGMDCQWCRSWYPKQNRGVVGHGICKRMPPLAMDSNSVGIQPLMPRDGRCGEWQPHDGRLQAEQMRVLKERYDLPGPKGIDAEGNVDPMPVPVEGVACVETAEPHEEEENLLAGTFEERMRGRKLSNDDQYPGPVNTEDT